MPHIIRAIKNVILIGEINSNEGILWKFIIENEPKKQQTIIKTTIMDKNKKLNNNVEIAIENFWQTIFIMFLLISIFYAFCYFFFFSKTKSSLFWHKIFCCFKQKNQSTQDVIDRTVKF